MAVTLAWAGENLTFEYGLSIGIQKSFNRNEDGSLLNEQHTINIRGQLVANGATADARYLNLVQQVASNAQKIAIGGGRTPSIQMGSLVINSSTAGELLNYDNVSLQSINISEPSDDTAGIQLQEIALTFETFNTPSDPVSAYKLRSYSENIDYKKEDNAFSYLSNNIDSEETPYYAFTVTHTVSAQGYVNNGASKGEAFEQAYNYVTSRLKDDVGVISTDAFGRAFLGSSALDMKNFEIASNASDVVSSDIDNYQSYNKMRISSSDVSAGSYSVTTTYLLSREETTIELSASYNRDESGESSISVDGTIQGLSKSSVKSVTHDKFAQAKTTFTAIAGNLKSGSKIYSYASEAYNRYQIDKTGVSLRDVPLNYTLGENKNNGTITFSVSYRVYPGQLVSLLNSITGSIVATASIVDDNRAGASSDVRTVVIIPIISRLAGPIIQDMGTTKERTRTVSIDVTLEQRYRTYNNDLVRTQSLSQLELYKPSSYDEIYIQNFAENWDWTSGKYNVTITWIYTI